MVPRVRATSRVRHPPSQQLAHILAPLRVAPLYAQGALQVKPAW